MTFAFKPAALARSKPLKSARRAHQKLGLEPGNIRENRKVRARSRSIGLLPLSEALKISMIKVMLLPLFGWGVSFVKFDFEELGGAWQTDTM